MSLNLREIWRRLVRWYAEHSPRDRRIIAAIGLVVALYLLDLMLVEPVRAYRQGVADEITAGQEALERAARFVSAAPALKAERDELKKRLDQAKSRLLPGGTATLGAAALQERTNTIANEKGIAIQSTQVMKEEQVDPFRKVAVRLTLAAEPKPLADFLATVEYGQQLSVPFIEATRRGAAPGKSGPRTIQATVEVSGFVLQEAKAGGAKDGGAKGGGGDGERTDAEAEATTPAERAAEDASAEPPAPPSPSPAPPPASSPPPAGRPPASPPEP